MVDGKVQTIVRFNSWKNRCLIFSNRKKGNFSFSVDLTQEIYRFFKATKVIADQYPDKVSFPFIDVNCRIGVKLKSGYLKFPKNTKELMDIL